MWGGSVRRPSQLIKSYGWIVLLGLIALTGLFGCGQDGSGKPELPELLIPVQGEVTLDGKPLAGALVLFLPPAEQDPWREAKGITDDEGNYELTYFGEAKGTVAGNHRVKITCPDPEDIEKQIVPPQYNIETTLKADVATDQNVINFNLKTGGADESSE